ncbi:hypothetical protein DC522_12515 [Microvirga sp. KLBC 81]|uniref:site-specific integrase n=1 Tax=Microvirga sp. KLBC 81 TaxID=1862707 RepID=UPI000D51EDCE|nr:site-specific integrase [Microvirga sp. KLBC 81]PVE24107.1 hypothetical protein DC522_12515 [Microvirga sp. KLBC 81]
MDWGARKLWILGKGNKLASISLPPSVRKLLWLLQGHHLEAVFTYVATYTRKGFIKGERYPIAYEGLKTIFRRTIRGKIKDYRWHDNRHTAAIRVLRATGKLRIVKEMLRHEGITTTLKYAHVLHDDVLEGMEKAALVPTETASPDNIPDAAEEVPGGAEKKL